MFHAPDNYQDMSLKISEVLDDIGINEEMVLKTRRAVLLEETMSTVTSRAANSPATIYNFGSRSEVTTTPGLKSDLDDLVCQENVLVINDMSQWRPDVSNYLMIQGEAVPPGYCLLQSLRSDAPLSRTHEEGNYFVKDTSGRILYKNTSFDAIEIEGRQRQGPSLAATGIPGVFDSDKVPAFPCSSWPECAKSWLVQFGENIWPTEDMLAYARTTKCFVVGVGNKVSENEAFEWRISTSLAERCLMFSLNITQIRCYILMKMILKTYINIDGESFISSFMCKTVMWHCIARKPTYMWDENNVLNCLNLYIRTLRWCVANGNCPHFIVPENNLMGGRFSPRVKRQLLERISNLLPFDGAALFGLQIDALGQRLQIKLNKISEQHCNIRDRDACMRATTNVLFLNTAANILDSHYTLIYSTKDEIAAMNLEQLPLTLRRLNSYCTEYDELAKVACKLIAPLYCTLIGSLAASKDIKRNNSLSQRTVAWLEEGLESDVASSKLKYASIIYSTGDMERTALLLDNIEREYNTEVVEPVCGCYDYQKPLVKKGFGRAASQCKAEQVKDIVAFCVRFFQGEINCVPHELQYEMFRSTIEDLKFRQFADDYWMSCAMIDSLPLLHFLQYKTYGSLKRRERQVRALNKLVGAINSEPYLGHRETALNVLGQCLEQEHRPVHALDCYRKSLQVRQRNNAAKIHICRCLADLARNP